MHWRWTGTLFAACLLVNASAAQSTEIMFEADFLVSGRAVGGGTLPAPDFFIIDTPSQAVDLPQFDPNK